VLAGPDSEDFVDEALADFLHASQVDEHFALPAGCRFRAQAADRDGVARGCDRRAELGRDLGKHPSDLASRMTTIVRRIGRLAQLQLSRVITLLGEHRPSDSMLSAVIFAHDLTRRSVHDLPGVRRPPRR
jgi:hypothetical protein